MPTESFRFIHASDFHLERTLGDLDELPKHLSDAIADAPWKAAEAVFEAALIENVDFVLLCGDLLSPSLAGPRGMSMLVDAFDQLAERHIEVFWASGAVDAAQYWPDSIPLPENVVRFPRGRAVRVPVTRAGTTIAMVVGRSGEASGPLHVPSYRLDPTDEFTVGVGYGKADAESLADVRFDYWALGGSHKRSVLEEGAVHGAVYCGTPQGRSLEEPGAHGFHLVDVDADESVRLHAVDVDSFRYCNVTIDAGEMIRGTNIRQTLSSRVSRLLNEHGKRHLLIGWELQPTDSESLEVIGDPAELLTWLRSEFGSGSPAAWSLHLKVRPPNKFPKQWREEDTILGDYLRAASKHRKTSGRELNILPFTEEHPSLAPATATLLADSDAADREQLLDEATLVGVNLLRGGKLKS